MGLKDMFKKKEEKPPTDEYAAYQKLLLEHGITPPPPVVHRPLNGFDLTRHGLLNIQARRAQRLEATEQMKRELGFGPDDDWL